VRALPEALQPFAAYPQFILHRDKIPTNPTTGRAHDPHDPAIWMEADAALATGAALGYGVGFVFTAQDPFFFFDLDACLQPDGTWSQLATDMCARFTGCAIEVSQSGQGLHIFGQGVVPDHACKNIPLGLELYTEQRFVALTGTGAVGSAAHAPDCLPWLVSEYFPPSEAVAGAEWTDGPCPEWRGPTDDDELISRILASRTTAGSVFAGRASVQQLWSADPDALAVAYPDERGFDHSSADAALCQHLAFWTGKDCERIDRLFRRSALYRDKWETREDYRYATIKHAVGHCRDVLGSRQADATPLGDEPDSVAPSDPMEFGGTRASYQYLALTQQLEHFKGCVYIRDLHRVFTPDGALLKPEQFKATYSGYVFAMDAMNDKTSKNAWEVFTESQATIFPRAHNVCFRPECEPGALIHEEGQILINTYTPAGVERKDGDPKPFLDHVAKLLPNERDRSIVLAYMAAVVQYPGVKFQWAPLLQGVEGNGKSLLMTAVAKGVGIKYTHKPPAADISNVFNAWISRKLFIAVEEVYVADRQEVIDALKPLITDDRVPVTSKGVDQQTGDNRANFMMASNHRDAYRKTANDRRVAMFFTAQQTAADLTRDGMDGRYFPDLYAWLKADGYAIMAKYLAEYPIAEELNPATYLMRAPMTSSTDEAIASSLGGVEQEIAEAVSEGRPGFAGGWVSSMALDKLIKERRDEKRITPNKRKELLIELGYVLHPALKDGRLNTTIMQEGGKPRIYIKADHLAANNVSSAAEVLRLYSTAQGYAGGAVGMAAEVFK
jgi:hypothetical protein